MTFWDREELVGSVVKNKRGEVYQVRLCELRKRKYLDIRTMYPGEDGALLPGKGVTIALEVASDVVAVINKALSKDRPIDATKRVDGGEVLATMVQEVL